MRSRLSRLLAGLLFCGASIVHAQQAELIFVGDLMLDDGPGRAIASGRDPFAPFAAEFANADAVIGNLECPIANSGAALPNKIFTFHADPRVLGVLRGRFTALSVANNHAGDYGKGAFLETLRHLDAAGIAHFGGGTDLAAAHAPLWLERHGLRIAVLGYDEFKPRSFEAGAHTPGVAWSEDDQVIADIGAARAAGADVVLTFMHWGWEHEAQPSARQRQLARIMIDAGASAVIGAHPHITQGSETYRGKPIIYSLGNFVFDSFSSTALRTGWLLRLTVDRQGVVAWRTRAALMDDDGLPQPQNAPTPCGRRGAAPARCGNETPRQ